MLFLQQLLEELGEWCGTSTSADLKAISARVEHEGLSFLTITLPTFAKDLQKGLDQGYVDRNLFKSFSWKGGLPRIFSGFLGLVFDRTSGRLVDDPSVVAIYAVRQITMAFGKIELDCSDERQARAMKGYIDVEGMVRESDERNSLEAEGSNPRSFEFRRISSLLFRDVFSVVDLRIYLGEVVPRVSSGATAERLRGNSKYDQAEWTERLEASFPSREFLASDWRDPNGLADVRFLEPGAERPSRVISVPKTLKTPRIIAIEPLAMQYCQQGILEAITEAVEDDYYVSRFISWKSQVPNQHLAFQGSLNGDLATLDLSEASDRVSNQHVRALLERFPHLAGAVDACRSRKADVPGHGVIRLAKFASMGSALCFPFEAMVFTTIIFMGIQKVLNRQLTKKDLDAFLGRVRVYGDDIIIPVDYVQAVIEELEAFGLKVNNDKSFWTGKFRESCGKDYYYGSDITSIRVRRLFPTKRQHVEEIQSIVSLRNQLYKKGLLKTVEWLDQRIERLIPFPFVSETSPALGRLGPNGYETHKTDYHLQRPLVRAAGVKITIPLSELNGYGALLKFFLKRGQKPLEKDHLKRAGRAEFVNIKIGWYPSY
ncbi:TPA_asm: RNA-directed RNA polymerase [ssRNA phage Esthiorhiza.1_6]|uniref:RNA-directed RNA polymerase n=2 Tax=Leviviricetes TaxID=2842243 RepID=A0A8S5KZR4_9VIRU|nr:RNA-directed RNA polymerase [ssRNA phage Esthiorhiza.1_6]QDH87665.1 MAG: RNA-dependent RNA polymerase [Leviviridae sp.]DAD50565.1 TPA_asm: RNA-directed RNA polymerase [ssRNA phage Esthiorhiza.1_6]